MSNLYETFKDCLVGDLNASEQRELAKFASALTAARGTEQQDVIINEAVGGMCDPEDFVKVSHLIAIVQGHEKTAFFKDMSGSEKVMAGTAIAGALAGLAPLAIQAVRKIRGSQSQNKALQYAMQQHPMLGEPANAMQTRQNFQVLRTFAPDVAGSAPVAANALVRMHRMGPAATDINTVKEMAETQKQIADKYKNEGEAFVSAGQSVRDLGNVYGDIRKNQVKKIEDAAAATKRLADEQNAQASAVRAETREKQYAADVRKALQPAQHMVGPVNVPKQLPQAERYAKTQQRLRDLNK